MSKRRPSNPFYILLLLAGIAFAITACAYGVMTVRQLQATRVAGYEFDLDVDNVANVRDFNAIVDQYGAKAMMLELGFLVVGTVGAIAYDQHLDKNESQEPKMPRG